MNKLRSWLYFWARLLGDINAVQRGPAAIGKRLLRKAAGRQMGKLLRKI